MYLSTTNYCISAKSIHQQPNIELQSSFITKFPCQKSFKNSNFHTNIRKRSHFYHCPYAILGKWKSKSKSTEEGVSSNEDFVTKVLKEIPSQVEPKYQIGNKFYTLRRFWILKKLNIKGMAKNGSDEGSLMKSEDVFLKDILREYKGKLYVPEQIFGANLSEEEEFEKNVEDLPKMSLEDFEKYMKCDKIKMLTFKEDNGASLGFGLRDFIVELKEMPGEKSLLRTNEYPNPPASKISSRVMVELGMLTIVLTAAAVIVGAFLASAVFAVTSFVFAVTVCVLWPVSKPFLRLFFGIFSKLYEVYTFGGVSAGIEMLKPIILVFVTMFLLVRFTLSRRPKNFRKWDIWQGIEFSQSKPQASVGGSTGVTFNDVAGIEEAVEELQETLVAKAIAGEAGVPLYQMAGSEFVEVLVGVGSARIRDLFRRAKLNKPSVIFIDEIDALATRHQGIFSESTDHLYNGTTQERETTLNQLLIELDGFDTGKGVIFLGATNRRDLLDPALLRPDRFDRKIRIRPPNAKGRLEILKVHEWKVKLSDTVDLASYAQNLPGWSGAKLAQLLQEAALVVTGTEDAVDRLTEGPRWVGVELGHQGQCRRAITEVGTALTYHLLRQYENAEVERCDRISINPRGQVFLGGRAAEEVIYGRDTSRASVNYLADASWLAPAINFHLDDDVAKKTEELMCDMYGKTVLLNRRVISGDEIDLILSHYPPNTPTSLLMEEREIPGVFHFLTKSKNSIITSSTVYLVHEKTEEPTVLPY
ncbi:unnamed protein product [Withania somnifera]